MTESKKRRSWQRRTGRAGCAVLLFLLVGGFAAVLQGQEGASPAAEHRAISTRYRKEAAETREAIKRHQIATDVYRRGTEPPYTVMNPQGRKRMVQHCERLIGYYAEAPKELDVMATEHEAIAKQDQGRSSPQ